MCWLKISSQSTEVPFCFVFCLYKKLNWRSSVHPRSILDSRKCIGRFSQSDSSAPNQTIHSHIVRQKRFFSAWYFIHYVVAVFFFPHKRKGCIAGFNFHEPRGCGWFLLPRKTNHLIKKKWAGRINAGHSHRGDASLQRDGNNNLRSRLRQGQRIPSVHF